MNQPSVLEKLQATNMNSEIWWDSSPLDFKNWSKLFLNSILDQTKRAVCDNQLKRFICIDQPEKSFIKGVTTNPSLIAKSILDDTEVWAKKIKKTILRQLKPNTENTFDLTYQEAIQKAALAILPIWNKSDGKHGWVSGQLDPRNSFDTDAMMEQALQLSRLAPNIMIKVPGTMQGYEVIRRLVSRGISINNTLSFTMPQFFECIRAIEAGLHEARRQGVNVDRCRSVVTYMIGRFGSQGDLLEEAKARNINLSLTDIRWAELAIIKRIYSVLQEKDYPIKMLLSSLQVDDPKQGATSLSMHLEHTAGADIAYTCKPDFISDLMLRQDELKRFDSNAIHNKVPASVLNKLMQLPYFVKAYEPDGMLPEEFASHGAFITTFAEVNRNQRRLIDFITRQIQLFSKNKKYNLAADKIAA